MVPFNHSGVASHVLRVGPVLQNNTTGRAVLAAIQACNVQIHVQDRGSYLRVGAEGQCMVTRQAIEAVLGRPFRFPIDLEAIMPSFAGRLAMTADAVTWTGHHAKQGMPSSVAGGQHAR